MRWQTSSMGKIDIPYLKIRRRGGRDVYYWIPKETYFINGAWQKCPLQSRRLPDSPAEAVSLAQLLNKELQAWRAGESAKGFCVPGTLPWLVNQYKESTWFTDLAESTQREHGYVLDGIKRYLAERKADTFDASEFTRKHARLMYEKVAKDKPGKAEKFVTLCRIVYNYGIEIEAVKDNPFKALRVKKNKPRRQLWLDLDQENPMHWIEAFQAKAIEKGLPSQAFAMDLGLYSCQREGDLLKLTWNKYQSNTITLRQGKTGAWVEVQAVTPLQESIARYGKVRKSPVMLVSERTGKPYSKDHFSDIFREIRDAAKLPKELQFRDLRRTGMVLLKLAGCSNQEIANISGHSSPETSRILDTYLPKDKPTARNAIAKLEAFMLQKWNASKKTGV